MHAKQCNLEATAKGNSELKELLDLLVSGKAPKDSDGAVWMGGLCRALKNRDLHRCNFSANVEEELKKVQEAELGETWTGQQQMPTGKHSVVFCTAALRFTAHSSAHYCFEFQGSSPVPGFPAGPMGHAVAEEAAR